MCCMHHLITCFAPLTSMSQEHFRINQICAETSSVSCVGTFITRDQVDSVAISPSKLCIAMGHRNGSIKLLHAQSDNLFLNCFLVQQLIDGTPLAPAGNIQPRITGASCVPCLSFSPCGRYLASVTRKGSEVKTTIFCVSTGSILHTLQNSDVERIYPCTASVDAVACVVRCHMLIALGKNKAADTSASSVQLWRMQSSAPPICIQVLSPKDATINSLSFSPSWCPTLSLLCSGCACVDMWAAPLFSAGGSSDTSSANFTFTSCSDHQSLGAMRLDATFTAKFDRLWQEKFGKTFERPGSERLPHFRATFGMCEGSLVVTQRFQISSVSYDPRICYRSARFERSQHSLFGTVIHTIGVIPPSHADEFRSVALSPNGFQLASCGSGGICLWDLRTGNLLQKFGSSDVTAIAYIATPGAAILASINSLNVVKLWL
jgi:WD40 repeat protein